MSLRRCHDTGLILVRFPLSVLSDTKHVGAVILSRSVIWLEIIQFVIIWLEIIIIFIFVRVFIVVFDRPPQCLLV